MRLQCNFRETKALTVDGQSLTVAPGWHEIECVEVTSPSGLALSPFVTLLVEDAAGSVKAVRPAEDYAIWSLSFWPGFLFALLIVWKLLL